MGIGIHEVVALTTDRLVGAGKVHYPRINVSQCLFIIGEFAFIGSTHGVNAPIVEDGGATVATTESFLVHALLAVFLCEIVHVGTRAEKSGDNKGGDSLEGIAGKELRGYALLVVILKEIEHVVGNVVGGLPCRRDAGGTAACGYVA